MARQSPEAMPLPAGRQHLLALILALIRRLGSALEQRLQAPQ